MPEHDPEALLAEFARALSRGRAHRPTKASFARRERKLPPRAPSLFEEQAPADGDRAPAKPAPVDPEQVDADLVDPDSAASGTKAPETMAPETMAPADAPLAEGTIRLRRSARVGTPAPRTTDVERSSSRSSEPVEPLLPFPPAESTAERGASNFTAATRPRWRSHPALSGGAAFETFVVDEENQLAYRAVLESAYRPGALAQLVFLYGARGTGKSHLLSACQQVLGARHERVVIRSAERLTQEFTLAVSEQRVDALFEGLSSGDALILDEVHRFGARRATRAFVARLILRYIESGRLALLASRYHARQIHGLEERQISLFLSGFSVQLRPPAEATKERWLRQRHRLLTGEDPPREIHRLARAIRGGLGDVASAHDRFLFGAEIDELAGLFGTGMPSVIDATAEQFSIESEALGQRASSRALSRARDVASHVALRLGYRAEIVGRHLGQRRPQTVRAAARRIAEAIETDLDLRNAVESILMRLSG